METFLKKKNGLENARWGGVESPAKEIHKKKIIWENEEHMTERQPQNSEISMI